MNNSEQIKILLLSSDKESAEVFSAQVDIDVKNKVAEAVDSYRSLCWKQGYDPEKDFREKSDWHVYEIKSPEALVHQGVVIDFAKDLLPPF